MNQIKPISNRVISNAADSEISTNPVHILRKHLEEASFVRLFWVVKVLGVLSRTCLIASAQPRVSRVILKAFKIFTCAAQVIIKSRRVPSQHFQKLVHNVSKNLTSGFYEMLSYQQKYAVDDDSSATINREKFLVPNIIYQVEQFEHYVIKLSQQSKIDMTRWLKRSTSRDFRIDANELARLQEEAGDEQDDKLRKKKQIKKRKETAGGPESPPHEISDHETQDEETEVDITDDTESNEHKKTEIKHLKKEIDGKKYSQRNAQKSRKKHRAGKS